MKPEADDHHYGQFHDALMDNSMEELRSLLDDYYFDPGTIASSVSGYVALSNHVNEQGPFDPAMFKLAIRESELTGERALFNVVNLLFTAIKNKRETTAFAEGAQDFFEQMGQMFGGDQLAVEAGEDQTTLSDQLHEESDRFARALDCLLDFVDEPYDVLDEHNLIGEWYEGNEMVEEMMGQRDDLQENVSENIPDDVMPGLQDQERYDDQIMYVLLHNEHPTDSLKNLANALIENGYDLSDEQKQRYGDLYG